MRLRSNESNLVYCLTTGLDAKAVHDALRLLSDEEQARCMRFRFDRHRRDYAVAHALLRRMVSDRTGERPEDCQFVTAGGGKPRLARDLGLAFSLSHTDGLVVCAIAEAHSIGVDAESMDREVDWYCLSQQFFSPTDLSTLEGFPADARPGCFIELWTLKEAFLKATGEGLASLSAFGFAYDGRCGLRTNISTGDRSAHWHISLYEAQGYRLALAVHGIGPNTVRIYRAPDVMAPLVPAELPLLRCSSPPDFDL